MSRPSNVIRVLPTRTKGGWYWPDWYKKWIRDGNGDTKSYNAKRMSITRCNRSIGFRIWFYDKEGYMRFVLQWM